MRAAVDDLADTVLAIAAGWHVIPMKQRSA
jgi:hypothetical protein